MRISLQITRFNQPAEQLRHTLRSQAQLAESVGFYGLWVMDHFYQLEFIGKVEDGMMECFSTLGYLAAVTEKIQLGTLVVGAIYRQPGVLLKTATSLDVLAGGRTYLGLGAAWYDKEALGLGLRFPPLKERFEILEETLQMAHALWGGKPAFRGRHVNAQQLICNPPPISQPHPKLLIGGSGEHKTLKLVAQYADACNIFAQNGVDFVRQRLGTLRQHCEAIGRDYNSIERTGIDTVDFSRTSPEQLLERLQQYATAGLQHIIFNLPNDHSPEPLEIFGKHIISQVADW